MPNLFCRETWWAGIVSIMIYIYVIVLSSLCSHLLCPVYAKNRCVALFCLTFMVISIVIGGFQVISLPDYLEVNGTRTIAGHCTCQWCNLGIIKNYPRGDDTTIFKDSLNNTTTANALAPCTTKPSTSMLSTQRMPDQMWYPGIVSIMIYIYVLVLSSLHINLLCPVHPKNRWGLCCVWLLRLYQ